MHLKKIEINGFKSFANKTILNLEKGITAIVGPNGSGKSNIADAIKWVLGEQSAKSLRGKKSEDIIFAGSEKKAQVSTASVFLAFGDKENEEPLLEHRPPTSSSQSRGIFPKEGTLGFEEVIIGRKIFRDGTAQYLINGSKVRLSDIIENLAAFGIGRGDHAVVNQGMADKILASTPLERRLMLEEAAGIKQFRIKRDQAERKLEATDQNMARISDLLAEIEPRLKVLRKQAEKAEKRSEVETSLKNSQKKYYSAKILELKNEKEKFDSRKKILSEKIEKEKNALFGLEGFLKKESEKEYFGTERVAEIRNVLQEASLNRRSAEKEIAILEGRIDLLKRQIFEKERRAKTLEVEREAKSRTEKKPETKLGEKILVSKMELKNLLVILDSSNKESIETLKSAIAKAIGFLKRLIEIKEEDVQEIPRKTDPDASWADRQAAILKKEIMEDDEVAKKLKIELPARKNQLNKIEKEIGKFEVEIIQINQEDQKRRSKFFEIEREIRGKRDELDKLKNEENAIKVEESRVFVHLEDLEKEIRSELEENFDFENINNFEGSKENLFILESNIRKLKAQLEQIGGIDGLTIQEHKETESRFSAMSKEYGDMEDTKKNLKGLIKELDDKMEKKFNESFETIANEFEKYFKMIFGGGSAKIFYSKIREEKQEDGGDAEESGGSNDDFGVEITAIPPGKKTKNMSVLSGGERALISISLLFAIIASNPPPFCVLDEVDAALDEANSSRIGHVFKELSKKTQFIIITHNREIMNQSSALYGVTMQKDGVSQLLSVRLEK